MRNHVTWWKQSAELRNAPSETKWSDKNMGASAKSHPIQQSPGMIA
jgi:hypothetical protein